MSESRILAAALQAAQLIGIFPTPARRIGTLIPGIVIEEDHEDALTITDHPVEQGAIISDHAFKNPASLTINCAWSNTQADLFDFSETYIFGIYGELLTMQASRQLLTIITGKRMYSNMLLEVITTSSGSRTEYQLPVQLQCRQIIVVSVTAGILPPLAQHQDPQQSGPVITSGSQSPQTTNQASAGAAVPPSILNSAAGASGL